MPGTALEAPAVGIIVVTWNGLDHSRRCLASLQSMLYPRSRICLVDNGSRPELPRALSAEYPEVEIVSLPENRGYPAAWNAGIAWARRADVRYGLILNDDTIADEALLDALVASAEAAGGQAIIAPKILRRGPGDVIWSAGGRVRRPWLKADHIGVGQPRDACGEPREVEWASGCALLFSLAAVDQIGLPDERYFLYLEDVDWCLRARRRGVRVRYEPRAVLWHDVSASMGALDSRTVRYYSYRNYYLLAFAQPGVVSRTWFAAHLVATLVKIGVRTALFPSYRRDGWYHARTRALFDFLRGRFGRAPYADEPRVTAGQAG